MKARLPLILSVLAAFALAIPAPALASIQLHSTEPLSKSQPFPSFFGAFSLTPALSPEERENSFPPLDPSNGSGLAPAWQRVLPLPAGAGWGEGESTNVNHRIGGFESPSPPGPFATVSADGQLAIVYDGDGHRVKKTISGGATYYVVDDRNPTGYAQVIEELTQAYSSASASKARS